jgi:hypothetical protein
VIAERVRHPWTIGEAQRELGDLFRLVGRDADAQGAFQAAAQAFEKIGAVSRADAMRSR